MNSAILEGTLGTLTLSEEQRPIGGTDLVPNVEEQRAGQRVKAILATARELGINLTPQSRILDFGCGLGYYTLALRKMGLLSYGCDVFDRCQAMAQACRSITPEHLFSIVSLDDYRLPYPDGHFDFIFSDHVMEHVLEYSATLREMRRVLRRGGSAFHIFPSRYRILESHLKVPFGGCVRSPQWFALWAQLGIGRAWHGHLAPAEIGKRNSEWVSTRVNYLSKKEINKSCSRHFNTVRFVEDVALASFSHVKLPLMSGLISTFHVRALLLA